VGNGDNDDPCTEGRDGRGKGRGEREGGVGPESEGGVEERRVVGRWEDPGVTKVGGDTEFISTQGGDGGTKRSRVGPFRESMEGHAVVGTVQTEEGTLYVCFDGVGEGSVRVGETYVE
jgi:hypothetical protein